MVPAVERKADIVKRKSALALASSFAALTLGGMQHDAGDDDDGGGGQEPPPANTVTGSYLSAKFAASAGDVKGAATFYAETLKEDPNNTDLLVSAFMYAAESGDIESAIALSDRVIAKDTDEPARASDPPGRRLHEEGLPRGRERRRSDRARAPFRCSPTTSSAPGPLRVPGEIDGALAMLDGLMTQRGVDGLRLMHKALILDYAGRDEDADAAYRQALAVMGMGPRISDAYGRFLARKARYEEAKTLYSARADGKSRDTPSRFSRFATSRRRNRSSRWSHPRLKAWPKPCSVSRPP